jgi:23S rRNA pseudouridine1911/1915/1917 synthase
MALPDPSTLHVTTQARNRLDRSLADAHPEISRARFQRLIADGHVAVEGQSVTATKHMVNAGQVITVTIPPPAPAEPEGEAIDLQIAYEDADLLVIDKPAGLVVHPGAGNERGTLVNALIAHCGESLSGIGGVKRPGIVHRLDKDTSGLLVVAKTDRAHKGLSEQFASHGLDGRLERSYLALVWGVPEKRKATVSVSLARSHANRKKIAPSQSALARSAVTHYEVLDSFGVASLIRCTLETGRTHQIRVHMAHVGHPVMGDQTYGSGFKSSSAKLTEPARQALKALNRQALHAATLGFEHPVTGRNIRLESALPADMERLLASVKKFSK